MMDQLLKKFTLGVALLGMGGLLVGCSTAATSTKNASSSVTKSSSSKSQAEKDYEEAKDKVAKLFKNGTHKELADSITSIDVTDAKDAVESLNDSSKRDGLLKDIDTAQNLLDKEEKVESKKEATAESESAAESKKESQAKVSSKAAESSSKATSKATESSSASSTQSSATQSDTEKSGNANHANRFSGDTNTAQKGRIVGNVRSKIYHVETDHNYKMAGKNAIYFNSEAEAQAAGYRPSKR